MKYIGLYYWVLSCFLGSSIYSYVLVSQINSTQVFDFGLSDFIIIDFIIILFSLIVTLPYLFFYKKALEKVNKIGILKSYILINYGLLIMILIAFVLSFYLMKSITDALGLIFSFGLPGFVFGNLFFTRFKNRFS